MNRRLALTSVPGGRSVLRGVSFQRPVVALRLDEISESVSYVESRVDLLCSWQSPMTIFIIDKLSHLFCNIYSLKHHRVTLRCSEKDIRRGL